MTKAPLPRGFRFRFCGINPGFRSAAAGAHFANPRNDFWRLLRDAGLTPRLLAPEEQQTILFMLPSTSPANAVPYDERLRWFKELARLV